MAEDDFYAEEKSSSGILILLAGIAFLLALGALAWIYSLQNRMEAAETKLNQAQEQRAELMAQQTEIRRQLRATTEAFGAKVGITQRQIELRSEDVLRQQEAETSRLSARLSARIAQQEADTRKQVGSVSKAVSNVRTDVGGVKRDVASTRQELATTEQQLHAAIGDMGVQSGLIAKNAQQLDYLKHLGDRNYSEFTLRKGQSAQAISTIKLQLRKADAKRSRYTLEIFADDKRVEKKNRDVDEPLQFYAGKPPMLFEIVVNQIDKNQVSGYLSAPKNTQPTANPADERRKSVQSP